RSTRRPFPNLPAGFRVDRVDVPVVAAKIKDFVVPDRRRNDAVACREFPFYPMKLPRRLRARFPGVRRVAAEHRLRMRRERHRDRAKANRETKNADPVPFHDVLRKTSGASIAPWLSVPLISPDSFQTRPSN